MQIETANAERLRLDAAAVALEPPPPVDYVRWAESNIAFSERELPFPGPYNRTMFPYFDEPLRALSPDDPCRVVTTASSARIRKTAAGNIFVAGSLAMDPANILVTHPTEDNARRLSKFKLAPLLRGPAARARHTHETPARAGVSQFRRWWPPPT